MKPFALLCLVSLLVAQPGFSQQQAPVAKPQATPPPAAATAPSQPPPPGTLLDGVPVKLKLAQTVSSADAKVNDHIAFTVIEEVRVDNVVVIAKGADAIATVTEAEHKRTMGRAGKLNVVIDSVRLVDGEKASLRASKEAKGGGHVGAMTGAIVATSIIFFPAAPLFLFIHGKDITIPQGTEITAFVEGDMHLDMAKFAPAPAQTNAPLVASVTALDISASVANCDITIDGAFMGNTPSTLSIAPGPHEITISKKGYNSWTRKMNIVPGAMHLNAELQATTSAASPVAPATAN